MPFGSLTRWPNDGPFRTATTFSTLPLLDIKPTLAYKATENLSLGLGADIYTFSGLVGEGHVERHSVSGQGASGFQPDRSWNCRQGHCGWFQCQSVVYGVAQCGWEATGEHRDRLPQSSDLAPERRIIGEWSQRVRCQTPHWSYRKSSRARSRSGLFGRSEREWKLEMDVDYVGWKSVRNLDVTLGKRYDDRAAAELA